VQQYENPQKKVPAKDLIAKKKLLFLNKYQGLVIKLRELVK
jgi:hypothetical protein